MVDESTLVAYNTESFHSTHATYTYSSSAVKELSPQRFYLMHVALKLSSRRGVPQSEGTVKLLVCLMSVLFQRNNKFKFIPAMDPTSSQIYMKLIHHSSRNCVLADEVHLPYFHSYRHANCNLLCFMRAVEKLCHCVMLFVPNLPSHKACSATSLPCVIQAKSEYK